MPNATPTKSVISKGNVSSNSIEPRKKNGWLGYIGDYLLPNCIGIIKGHYKDPYKPTSKMESDKLFFFVAQFVQV